MSDIQTEFFLEQRNGWLEEHCVKESDVRADRAGEYIEIVNEADEDARRLMKVYLPVNVQTPNKLEESYA